MIETVWAFVATDADGVERELGIRTYEGWIPLVVAERGTRFDGYVHVANAIARASGVPYRIVEFSNRTDVTDQVAAVEQPGGSDGT